MSEILAASVHSGWDKRMEVTLSPKTVLDNKKTLEKMTPVKIRHVVMGLLNDCMQK